MAGTEQQDVGKEVRASPGKPGKLENLPKEDLIKYVKKQAAITQKTKAKCEELAKKCASLTAAAAEGGPKVDEGRLADLEREVTSSKEEREEMLAAYNAVQQQQLQTAEVQQKMEQTIILFEDQNNNLKEELFKSQVHNKDLSEQFDCLKMKEETTRSSFHSIQEEQDHLTKENEELKEQVDVLTEARDQTLQTLKSMKEDQRSEGDKLGDLQSSIRALEEEKCALEAEIESVRKGNEETVAQLRSDLNQLLKDKETATEKENSQRKSLNESVRKITDLEAKTAELQREASRGKGSEEKWRTRAEDLEKTATEMRRSTEDETDRARDRLTSSLKENESLTTKVNDLEETLKETRRKSSERDEADGAAKESLVASTRELDGWKERFGALEAEGNEMKMKLDRIQSEKEDALKGSSRSVDECESVRALLEETRLKCDGLEEERNRLRTDLHSQVQRGEESGSDLGRMQTRIGELEAERDAAATDMSKCRHVLNEKVGEHESLLKETELLKENLMEVKSAASSEVDKLKTDVEAKEKRIGDLVDESEEREHELSSSKDDQESLQMQLNIIKEAHMEAMSKCEELKAELKAREENTSGGKAEVSTEDWEKRLTTLTTEKEALGAQIDSLKRSFVETERAAKEKSERDTEVMEGLREEIKKSKNDVENEKNERERGSDSLAEELSTKLEALEKERDELCITHVKEMEDLMEENGGLARQLQELERSRSASDLANENLVREMEGTAAENQKYAANFDKLKRASQAKVQKLQERLEGLQAEKEAVVGRRSAEEEETRRKLEAENNDLRKREEILGGEVESMKESLIEKDGEFVRLQSDHENVLLEKDKTISEFEKKSLRSEKKLNSLMTEKESLEEDLEDGKESAKVVEDLLRQVRDLSLSKEELVDRVQELQSKVDVYEKEMVLIGEQSSEMRAVKDDLEVTLAQLKQELADKEQKLQEDEMQQSSEADDNVKAELATTKKQLKDSEDKGQKLKQLAMKVKKELEQQKKQVASLNEELCHIRSGNQQNIGSYQSLQVEYEKVQDKFDSENERAEKLSARLTEVVGELTGLETANGELERERRALRDSSERVEREAKTFERNLAETRCRVMVLENELEREKEVREEKEGKLDEELGKNLTLENRLEKQSDDNKSTTQRLELALKDASQSNLMDLEIAEYERTVSSLNATISDKEEEIAASRRETDVLGRRIGSMERERQTLEGQLEQAEERGNKLKQMLVKNKKDLTDAKRSDTEQRCREAALQGQVEHLTQQTEQLKVELSGMAMENQGLQDQVRSSGNANTRTVRALEMRNESLMDDLESYRSQLTTVQTEFESYKVRAQSVLKQQKTRDQLSRSAGPDLSTEEKERLEEVISQLRSKMQEANDRLSGLRIESEALQEEHDRLLQRHADMLQDIQLKEITWREKMETIRIDNQGSRLEQTETIKDLSSQNEVLASAFKDQVKQLREDGQKTAAELRQQLETTEGQLFRLREQHRAQQQLSSSPSREAGQQYDTGVSRPKSEEREQGEGMENPEQEVLHGLSRVTSQHSRTLSLTSDQEMPTFAQLLSTTSEDKQSVFSGMSSTAEEEHLKSQLITARKKMEHFTEITSENESTILRLSEQTKVLKAEIRRLERNQARENAISNMEYLKNVVLKFMILPKGEEKGSLVPVLKTMLKLSDDELKQVLEISQDDDGSDGASNLGSYLHRWSGGLM